MRNGQKWSRESCSGVGRGEPLAVSLDNLGELGGEFTARHDLAATSGSRVVKGPGVDVGTKSDDWSVGAGGLLINPDGIGTCNLPGREVKEDDRWLCFLDDLEGKSAITGKDN